MRFSDIYEEEFGAVEELGIDRVDGFELAFEGRTCHAAEDQNGRLLGVQFRKRDCS